MDVPAVEVSELVKRYPKSEANAVDGVSFAVAQGEVFGLLGPNGAGKTTTVGVLTTRVRPTAGSARIGGLDVGRDPVQVRRQLAVVPQRSNLDRAISIRDNLIFHAAYHGVPARERQERANELLDQFGLLARADVKPDFFSGGQSQRVMIARALMHAPRVLFLDEPTTGLDPAARLFVWDRLRELRERGVTLFLTTHDMDEAAALADRVGIMDLGRLLALDTPQALMRSLSGESTFELTADRPADDGVVDALASLEGVERVERLRLGADAGPALRVRLYLTGEAAQLVAPAAALLAEHGLALADVKLGAPTLEDVFIKLDRQGSAVSAVAEPYGASRSSQRAAFGAVLRRDLYVTWRELPAFLAQVILQPLFLLFVFGKVLGSLGYTQHGYANLLFPGLVALTAVITGMQTLAFPLVAEFGWTREIEDRLLAPMPTAFVAAEKVVFAALRAIVASLLMLPVGVLVLGSIPWRWSGLPLFVAGLLLGALVGAGFGLVLGTLVQPARINLLFSLVFTPLLFTGCSQYPWPSLARLRWFQVVTAANPMTYVSEALRGALVPQVPHIRPWICLVVLVGSVAGLLAIGLRGFYRRAVD